MRKKYAVGIDPDNTPFRFWTQNTAAKFMRDATVHLVPGPRSTGSNVATPSMALWHYVDGDWQIVAA